MRLAALLLVTVAGRLGAQDLGFHAASIVRRESNDLAAGFGVSIAASFRVGDILVDSSLARRANLRLGARVSVSETRFDDRSHHLCIDFCAPDAHDVRVQARMTKVALFVLPHHSTTTRLEIGGGVANNVYTRTNVADHHTSRDNAWSFVASAAAAWRFQGESPLWLQVEYTRHAEPAIHIADGSLETPGHSVNAGLVYRFSDRRR